MTQSYNPSVNITWNEGGELDDDEGLEDSSTRKRKKPRRRPPKWLRWYDKRGYEPVRTVTNDELLQGQMARKIEKRIATQRANFKAVYNAQRCVKPIDIYASNHLVLLTKWLEMRGKKYDPMRARLSKSPKYRFPEYEIIKAINRYVCMKRRVNVRKKVYDACRKHGFPTGMAVMTWRYPSEKKQLERSLRKA